MFGNIGVIGKLSAIQKNIIAAARSNSHIFLEDSKTLYPKSDFEAQDPKGNTCLWHAVSQMHFETI